MKRDSLMVSVCMITYNHEKFIKKAIEGVLMQDCEFSYELVIADDCSSDKTSNIIINIMNTHPRGELIKYYQNSFNIGMQKNFLLAYNNCVGNYIALCEGDDYWTDSQKIQKQIYMLEKNSNYSLCFHNAEYKYEDSKQPNKIINQEMLKNHLSIEEVIQSKDLNVPTASIVFRKSMLSLPKWFSYVQQGDKALQLLLASNGPFLYIDEVMSVYRKHASSVGATIKDSKTKIRQIQMYSYFNMHTNFVYNTKVEKKVEYFADSLSFSFFLEKKIGYKNWLIYIYLIYLKPFISKVLR